MRFHHSLSPLFFLTLFMHQNSITSSTSKPQKLIARLAHHGFVNTYYSDKSSMARYWYLQAKAGTSRFNDSIQETIFPALYGQVLLANISIGQPPIPQEVVVDSGSELLWIQCVPCNGRPHQNFPLFDPLTSSTYKPCRFSPNECEYTEQYADHTASKGEYVEEQLTLETSDDGFVQTPPVILGCSHDTSTPISKLFPWSGIMGLNAGPKSIALQLGDKFSYCLGSLSDSSYEYNHLALGEGAKLEGSSIPFFVRINNLFYISLEGISIGENTLPIHPDTFMTQPDGSGGIIIDSGTTLTYLKGDVVDLLKTEVEALMTNAGLAKMEHPTEPGNLCYEANMQRDLVGFPTVTFHLAEETDIDLDSASMFQQFRVDGRDSFCLAVVPTQQEGHFSVLGIMAQQNYNVGYDFKQQRLYIQRIDCQLLMD